MLLPQVYPQIDFQRRINDLARQIAPGEHLQRINISQWIAAANRMQLHDTFGWTFDLQQGIKDPFGTKIHLGLAEHELTEQAIFKLIPGAYALFFIEYRLAFFELLADARWRSFIKADGIFKMNTIIRSRQTDTYFSMSLTSGVSKVDVKGFPVAHFNRFHIYAEWDNRPLYARPRLFTRVGNDRMVKMEEAIHALAFKRIRMRLGYTNQEWNVIDLHAAGAEAKQCAEILGCAESTIYTHNRSIKERAQNILSEKFKDAQEVSDFLAEMKLTKHNIL